VPRASLIIVPPGRAPIASALVFLAVIVACSERTAGGSGPDGGTSTNTSGDTQATDARGDDTSAADTSSSADTGTGTAGEGSCWSFTAASCPDECAEVIAWRIADDPCQASPVDLCVPPSDDPGAELTTFWIDGRDGPLFVEVGGTCGIDWMPAAGFTECTGDAADPVGCDCFCTQGSCSGDADRVALEACGYAEPCPTVWVDFLDGSVDARAEVCVLEHLRDRVPGLYEWVGSTGFGAGYLRFYVDETGVQTISSGGDVTSCPTTSSWNEASRCELASADDFAACLDLVGTKQDCALTPEAWTTGCEVQPATCPGG
jgi:hypothetical protein